MLAIHNLAMGGPVALGRQVTQLLSGAVMLAARAEGDFTERLRWDTLQI